MCQVFPTEGEGYKNSPPPIAPSTLTHYHLEAMAAPTRCLGYGKQERGPASRASLETVAPTCKPGTLAPSIAV